MQSTIHAARGCGHLSRHERQRLARAEEFSRRSPAGMRGEVPVTLGRDELELIERLVRRDRTAVSSALLAIAGIAVAALTSAIRRVEDDASRDGRHGARHTLTPSAADEVMSAEASPVVVEVLRFEDLPLGSLASRRAVVRWSDGSEGEGLRWYSDEVLYAWFLDDPAPFELSRTRDRIRSTSESATTFSVAVTRRTTFGPAAAASRLCAAHSELSSRNSSAYQRCREAPARASRMSAATSSTTPASDASAIRWASTFGSRLCPIRSRSRSSEK